MQTVTSMVWGIRISQLMKLNISHGSMCQIIHKRLNYFQNFYPQGFAEVVHQTAVFHPGRNLKAGQAMDQMH